jgi:6-pyruvoyltetrahydropterin/6-carboxytetrahydropterin synthase
VAAVEFDMLQLSRTVRFCVNTPGRSASTDAGHNTFAAYPSMQGLGRHYELVIACRGEVDAATGYFVNIKQIDGAARTTIVQAITRACLEQPQAEPAGVLAEAMPALAAGLDGKLAGVTWRLSPYYSVEVQMPARNVAIIREQFEFAASHRLHCPELSDEQNREMFGKCNLPSGHGHNYRVEPAVEVPVGSAAKGAFTLQDLERVTYETIVSRFDHKHLNLDTEEFKTGSGLNPSVENIAKVCYDLLRAAIQKESPDVRLRSVTVWETEKTSCTYPVGASGG